MNFIDIIYLIKNLITIITKLIPYVCNRITLINCCIIFSRETKFYCLISLFITLKARFQSELKQLDDLRSRKRQLEEELSFEKLELESARTDSEERSQVRGLVEEEVRRRDAEFSRQQVRPSLPRSDLFSAIYS